MPDSASDRPSGGAARLLKGAAGLFVLLGAGFLAWLGRQWARYPELQASQFGFEAPLWPALGAFVLLGMLAVVALFWTAARRVERGEDLFAQRHRRRASEWERDSSNGRTAK